MTEMTEKRFIEARNNYETDIGELTTTKHMLLSENEDSKAEYVDFIIQDIDAENAFNKSHEDGEQFISLGLIKRDYVDYEGKNGSEEKVYFSKDNTKGTVECMFESGYVNIIVNRESPEGSAFNNTSIDWNNFKSYSQRDFNRLLNMLFAYATERDEEMTA